MSNAAPSPAPGAAGRPLRLALVTRRYPPLIGGAEKVLSYLAPALADEGAEVTVLTSLPPGSGLPEVDREDRPRGSLTVRRLPTARLRFVGTWLYMRNLRRYLEADPPDLAYVSMLKHDAYVTVGVGRRLGFPVVVRPEGAGATGDLAWQGRGTLGRRIGDRARRADAVVAISKGVEDELLAAGYRRDRVHRLPNGVPVPDRAWQRRAGWREAPRAVYVGRLAPEKGVDTLIEAWGIVRDRWPTAVLTLVGDGPERPALEAGTGKLGLGDAVEFLGARADVEPVLRGADLFVLPSREEGMSVALLEAMALGLPIVATSIPGNRRLIVDFKNGRLAPPDDPPGLARVILEQFAGFDRAFHMSRSARQRVELEFSIGAMARKHLELFRRVVAEARGGRADG